MCLVQLQTFISNVGKLQKMYETELREKYIVLSYQRGLLEKPQTCHVNTSFSIATI